MDGGMAAVTVGGSPVLLCRLSEALYAYHDTCPACRSALRRGRLDSGLGHLSCPGCGGTYDVRLAGAGVSEPGRHLVPLPLLVDDTGVRVAVSDGGLVGAGAAP
jgi:nitrite reductase/ring-hydroxylating ferredoxin subunit